MAISLDTSLDLGNTTATSLTTSYTNSGNILFVGVVEATTNKMSGVTYGGVALTESSGSPIQIPGDRFVHLFRIASPLTGANNVVITLTGSDFIQGIAASYNLSNGTIDLGGNTTGSSIASLSKSLTTTIDNDWTIAMFAGNGGTASAGAGTTLRRAAAGFAQFALFDSNGAITPAGSTTLNVNITGTPNAAMIMNAFEPAVATGNFFMLL